MRAAQRGHLEVVKVLVANDSILDIKCKVCFFCTTGAIYNCDCILDASGHVISIYACIKFSFAHIRLSCRRGKQPSCMQYKEEGTRRWSKNSAQQEQMCPLKTR